MIHAELWKKIKSVDFQTLDPSFPFVDRLASENEWSIRYAKAVIEEYKRFIYLSALSEQQLIPSDEVNQAWLLHLTYTRHYWVDFRKLVGANLHYTPFNPKGVNVDQLSEAYEYTKQMYRDEFHTEPRPQVWPPVSQRFNSKQNFVRVDKRRNLILDKPTKELPRSVARFFVVAAFPLSIMGYAMSQTSGPIASQLSSTGWMIVAGIAITIAIFGCLVWRMEHTAKKLEGG